MKIKKGFTLKKKQEKILSRRHINVKSKHIHSTLAAQ